MESCELIVRWREKIALLALIYVYEEVKKVPFYFMDEIYTALDYKNANQVEQHIRARQNVQHIAISLINNMYEQCDKLACIYKMSNVTIKWLLEWRKFVVKKTKEVRDSKKQKNEERFRTRKWWK